MRPKHPAEMPFGSGAWGCVCGGGNKVAMGRSLLPYCWLPHLHYFLGEIFVQEPVVNLMAACLS